jgi:hypothetical protein
MPRFHIETDVECETLEEAEEYAKRCLRQLPGFKHITLLDEEPLVTANPKGNLPAGDPDYLQVMLVHPQMIAEFQLWVQAHSNWALRQMPRFDMPAHHYTVTHHIAPKEM